MEIKVQRRRRIANEKGRSKATQGNSCHARQRCEFGHPEFFASYGISVKIRPARRSFSQPAPVDHLTKARKMDQESLGSLENLEAEKDAEEDSAYGNSQILDVEKTEDEETTISVSVDVNNEPKSLENNEKTTKEPENSDSSDIFDQLQLHFDKKDKKVRTFPVANRGRSRTRRPPTRSVTRTRSFLPKETLVRQQYNRSSSSFKNPNHIGYLTLPNPRRPFAKTLPSSSARNRSTTPKFNRQTSTPDSNLSNCDRSGGSSLGLSRIRAVSSSSVEFQTDQSQESGITSLALSQKSDSVDGKLENELESDSNLNKDRSKSNPNFLTLPRAKMLHSQHRRSATPDYSRQRDARRQEWFGPSPDGGRDYSGSRGSLDRMTADTIDSRRVRKRPSDKFNASIQSASQQHLNTLPPRSQSALAAPEMDNWSTQSVEGSSVSGTESWGGPVMFYVDKNGRVRQKRGPRDVRSTPPIPADWRQDQDVTICSIDSLSDNPTGLSESDHSGPRPRSATPDNARSTPSFDEKHEMELKHDHRVEIRSPHTPLDIALSEDHDIINRLAELEEEEFTTKLISAMKELKDIAEVARVIDEVDDEEWLLVFIGELEHRLLYLMKIHEEESEPNDHESNTREKATILDVALDLIEFLKDRSAYRFHRQQSIAENMEALQGLDLDNLDPGLKVQLADGANTIQRMRKMAALKPQNIYDMQKWQRQLFNLAGTLDKCLTVLEKKKPDPEKNPDNESGSGHSDKNEDLRDRRISEALSDYSTLSSGDDRLRDHSLGARSQSSSGVSFASSGGGGESNKVQNLRKVFESHTDTPTSRPNSNLSARNLNNNNNNNNNVESVGEPTVRRIPVLDLRSAGPAHVILSHVSATQIHERTDIYSSPGSIDGERFVDAHPLEIPVYEEDLHPGSYRSSSGDSRGPSSTRSSPSKHVMSAFCLIATDTRKRSASLTDTSGARKHKDTPQRHVAELRMDIGGAPRGRKRNINQGPSRRARSCDNSRNEKVNEHRGKEDEEMKVPHTQDDTHPSVTHISVSHPSLSRSGPKSPEENQSQGGARPKVRPIPQVSAATHIYVPPHDHVHPDTNRIPERRRRSPSGSSSDSHSGLKPVRVSPPEMTTSGVQCELDAGQREREKRSEELIKQLKRKAEMFKSGLEEAKQERDEKERKIAVLQARLDRTKKNLVTGESEKGAIEEEVDRLKKMLKEKSRESEEEIEALKRRIQELEKKLEKEQERYERMNETVETLQRELSVSERRCEDMKNDKKELEQQIHDLTMELMRERQHGREMATENARLEEELSDVNRRLEENAATAETAQAELRSLNEELEKQIEHQRYLADETEQEKLASEEKVTRLKKDLDQAEEKIEKLTEENERLMNENRELSAALSSEQAMSKDLAKCYMEQVDYLNQELKINEDTKKAQAQQYEKEIERILSEEGAKEAAAVEEARLAREEAEREKVRADELEKENEELKTECENLRDEVATKKDAETRKSTEDKAVQAEDTSYMRMRAFDWYADEAQRDARRLNDRGRQLELETRRRLREQRLTARQLNASANEALPGHQKYVLQNMVIHVDRK